MRGFGLPVWIGDGTVVGVKPDGCIGSNCQLYQYQTFSIAVIDMDNGEAKIIDSGKTISEVTIKDRNYTENIN